MTRVALLPRLSPVGVEEVLKQMAGEQPISVAGLDFLEKYSSLLSFAATGGSVDPQLAVELADGLRQIARDLGFPEATGSRLRATFDSRAATYLADKAALRTGEALRDDVWAFIATVMVPDVVVWRFPDRSSHRFHGGVRNALQRLFVRGVILDRGEGTEDRWLLVESLTEDAMVQVFERASLAGAPRLARAIAEMWLETSNDVGREAMEKIMRSAIKLVRIRNEIVDLASLDEDRMIAEVRSAFRQAIPMTQEPSTREASDQTRAKASGIRKFLRISL